MPARVMRFMTPVRPLAGRVWRVPSGHALHVQQAAGNGVAPDQRLVSIRRTTPGSPSRARKRLKRVAKTANRAEFQRDLTPAAISMDEQGLSGRLAVAAARATHHPATPPPALRLQKRHVSGRGFRELRRLCKLRPVQKQKQDAIHYSTSQR